MGLSESVVETDDVAVLVADALARGVRTTSVAP